MFDTVFGLPLHTLVVHAVVVLVPLAALGTVAIAAVPAWRARFGVPVLLLTVAAVASVPVAVQSGSAVVAAGVATYEVVRVGHAGSTAVWRDLVRNTGP